LIQGITSAGLASIFPAVSSPGNSALADFESALFALLGVAAAPGMPATASSPELVAPAKTTDKTTASDPPLQNTAQKRPADEKKSPLDQEIVPVAVLVPLPMPIPVPVQVGGAAPGAKLSAQPMSQQPGAPASVIAQTVPSPPVRATSAASLPSSADPAVAALQPGVTQALQQPATGVKLDPTPGDLPPLDDSSKDMTAQSPSPTMVLDKTLASLKAVVAQSTASEPRVSTESNPDVREAIPGVQPASSLVAVPNTIQPGNAQAQPQTPDGPAQPFAQAPAPRTKPDKIVEPEKTGIAKFAASGPRISTESNPPGQASDVQPVSGQVDLSSATQPGYAQAQPQTPDGPAQPPDKTLEAVIAEIAQPSAFDPRTSTEANANPRVGTPSLQPVSSQVTALPVPQPGYAQAQPQTPDTPAQPTAQTPVATEPGKTLESVKAEVAQPGTFDPRTSTEANANPRVETPSLQPVSSQVTALPIPQPGPTQAQPQTPDTPAQPASFNPPVILVNPLGKASVDRAVGETSSHKLPAAKFQSPAVSPSAAEHHGGKERGARATSPAEPKPDAPSGEPVKAIDQAGATDTPPAKAQPEVSGADALPPQAPRAEAVPQFDASDPSPKTDASSLPAAHNAAANSSPLPAERPPMPLFSSAQLIEKVSQSELRLGMRTGEFGNVEIRTTFDHQQLRAEISSERGELGQALSAELPGFEQRLREHDVPLSTVVVHQANAGASGGFDRPPRQQQPVPASLHVSEVSGATLAAAAPQPEAWEPEGILDVRI